MASSKPPTGIRPAFFLFLILIIAAGGAAGLRKLHHSDPELSDKDREAQYQLHRTCGDTEFDAGDLNGAFQEYSSMVDLFPDRPEGYGLRASIENSLEHSSQAIADDTRALDSMASCTIACGPTANAALLIDRARSYQRMGKSAPALQDADAALRLSPTLSGAHLVRAEAELALHQPRQSLADCNYVVRRQEDGQEYAYTIRGLSEGKVRHISLMADSALFAQAVRSDAEADLGNYAAAADDDEYVVSNHPNHAGFCGNCAWYEFKAGRLPAAIATARDGLSLRDVSAIEYFNLGLYYASAGDEINAQNAYATGLKYPNAVTVVPGARGDIATELKAHPNNAVLHKAQQWLSGSG